MIHRSRNAGREKGINGLPRPSEQGAELVSAEGDAEVAHANSVALISTTLQGETDAAKAELEAERARARSGTFRLRDHTASREACTGGTGQAAPAPSERDGKAGAYLSAEAADFLLGLAGEADDIVRQLTACQAVILDDRKTP